MASVPVSINGMDGAQAHFEMDAGATVRDLKEHIEQHWHIPVPCQNIIVDDAGLQDCDMLLCRNDGIALEIAMVVDYRGVYRRLGSRGRERNEAFELLRNWAQHDCQRPMALATLCLKDADFMVRRGGSRAIAEVASVGDEFAISSLHACLDDTNEWVRAAILESLSKIARKGDEVVTAYVCTSLQDPSDWVKREAAEALGKVASRGNNGAIVSVLEAVRCSKSLFLSHPLIKAYEYLAGDKFLVREICGNDREKLARRVQRAETLLAEYATPAKCGCGASGEGYS